MASFFDTSKNLSIYSIPIAWVIAFAPHAYAGTLAQKLFDPRSPRTLPENLKNSQTLDQATKDRIIRAEGAHANGFENLGLYAAAVLAGNMAGLPASTLNALTGGYLFSRILYNWVYINNTTVQIAGVRSMIYMGGIGCIITLFVKAGNVLREKGVISL